MDDFKVFPPSAILSSGVYYLCGADVCEEGLQFCNNNSRRCEYCADHHHDCFTYVQQQNCTQFCQDQWKKNQIEVSGVQQSQSEDIYKVLAIFLSALVSVIFVILLLRVTRIRMVIWNNIKYFIPQRIVTVSENLHNTLLASCTARDRNRRPQDCEGSGIEDAEAMCRQEVSDGENAEEMCRQEVSDRENVPAQSREPTSVGDSTARKENVVTTKISDTNKHFHAKAKESKDNSNLKISNAFDTRQPMDNSVGKPGETKSRSSDFELQKANHKDDIYESQKHIQQLESPEIKELSEQQRSRHTESENNNINLEEQGGDPHGELSTMSSRGGLQAMLSCTNPSTDNGYATESNSSLKTK